MPALLCRSTTMRRWKSFSTDSAVHGNDFELIPATSMESQHSVDGRTSRDFIPIYIVRELSPDEVGSLSGGSGFLEKTTPCGKILKIRSERMHARTETRIVCKFREIWLTGSRWIARCFPYKKNKNSSSAPAVASARIAPKICHGQLTQHARNSPNFIQIRSLPAELKPNAWTSFKRAVKYFQYSAKLLRRVKSHRQRQNRTFNYHWVS